jgi:hypothetical protein
MPPQKNGLDKLACEIDAVRTILQDVIVPEIKEQNAILHRRGARFDAILVLLHEHAALLRQQGEGSAGIEVRERIVAIEGRVTALESRN